MSRKIHRRVLALFVFGASFLNFLPAQAQSKPVVADPIAVGVVESAKAVTVARYIEAVTAAQADAWFTAVAVGTWAAAHQPAPVARASSINSRDLTPRTSTSSAGHSDAWWRGVSVCEQGGRNDPHFGYFSIMDGSAGGLPWDVQVGMANRIIQRAGDGAWARSCQAAGYRASPGG